jgi:hypothetical protein
MNAAKNKVVRFSFVFASVILLILQLEIPASSPARLGDGDDHHEGGVWQPTTLHPLSEGKPLDATFGISSTSGRGRGHVDSSNLLESSSRATLEKCKSGNANRTNLSRTVETIKTTFENKVASTRGISISTNSTTNSFRNTTTQLQQNILPSIVVQLQGQLGNNLCGIAHGRGVQLQLLRDYGINTQLVLQPPLQDGKRNRQWRLTRIELEQCFPHVSSSAPFLASPNRSSQDEIKELRREQMRWLSSLQDRVVISNTTADTNSANKPSKDDTLQSMLSEGMNGKRIHNYKVELDSQRLDEAFRLFRDLLLVSASNNTDIQPAGIQTSLSSVGVGPSSPFISLPFLLTNILASDYMVDHFYQDLRQYFAIDESCCKEIPEPDETVFVCAALWQCSTGSGYKKLCRWST